MSSSNVLISLRNVGVAYRRRAGLFRSELYWALRDVSLDLHRGETLGIIGRNGVGKSTLLQTIAGIMSPDVGVVINKGVSTSLLSLQVGFLPKLTGRENSILSGMLLGMSKKRMTELVGDIEEFSDLGQFFDQPVKSYSAGMRARLGFAVAYYSQSDVILIDEVLGVGDSSFRKKSTRAIKDVIASDKSVILVSHQPSTIRESCDRLVWIENGSLVKSGPVEDILSEYQCSFVQSRNPSLV